MRGYWVVAGLATAAGAFISCVGDEPVTPEPVPDSGTSNTVDSGTPDATVPPARTDYGIFLTRTRYSTNFAANKSTATVRDHVDALCQQAAGVANLDHRERYHAVITTVEDRANLADVELLRRYADAVEGRWCGIGRNAPRPDCSDERSIIFATPADVYRGPKATLETTETGERVPIDANYTKFYSGLFRFPEDQLPAIRNCFAWSIRQPFGDSGVLDGGPEVFHGIGSTAVTQKVGDFEWAASETQFCVDAQQLPLLCMEAPPEL